MFITIYYGDQKSLLVNPSCSVINLLNSIKERCGYGDTDRVLDLTDETGTHGHTAFENSCKLNNCLEFTDACKFSSVGGLTEGIEILLKFYSRGTWLTLRRFIG